jgi:4-hydroxy-3-polyprenylbenzoate decarboxylase
MSLSNEVRQDLRAWIMAMDDAGQLQRVSGAEREQEIGGIVDVYQRRVGNKALLFDDIPGYPKGYRILANILTSVPRINMTIGLPAQSREVDLVEFWRRYMRDMKSIPPRAVERGLIQENVQTGDAIDLTCIPTPRWHEKDGGYFIGTGCMVVMKDPDTGWINYGAYRVQVQGRDVASVHITKGKHGNQIMRKYHERGEPCPVAVVVGMHPALFMVSGLEIPHGTDEYHAAGGLLGEPVDIIAAPRTGLPIPANAEIAFEGYVHQNDLVAEGPFGEWAGYYVGGVLKEPAIRIETLMHRNDPILLGAVPGIPPDDDSFYRGTYRSGAVWNQLEAAGIPEVKGVWAHPSGGSRMWLTVSIKQQYPGHSKQAGLVASQCHAGAYANRYVVVVDDDIDPANMDKVVWAMCTRCDPRDDFEILRGNWTGTSDPMNYGRGDQRNSRVVIDACKPWHRRESFPIAVGSSAELDKRIHERWAHVLPA